MTLSYDRSRYKTPKDIAADLDVAPSTVTRWLKQWGKFYEKEIPDPVERHDFGRYVQQWWTYRDANKIKNLYRRHRANHS